MDRFYTRKLLVFEPFESLDNFATRSHKKSSECPLAHGSQCVFFRNARMSTCCVTGGWRVAMTLCGPAVCTASHRAYSEGKVDLAQCCAPLGRRLKKRRTTRHVATSAADACVMSTTRKSEIGPT